jgi:hypothetical protein
MLFLTKMSLNAVITIHNAELDEFNQLSFNTYPIVIR